MGPFGWWKNFRTARPAGFDPKRDSVRFTDRFVIGQAGLFFLREGEVMLSRCVQVLVILPGGLARLELVERQDGDAFQRLIGVHKVGAVHLAPDLVALVEVEADGQPENPVAAAAFKLFGADPVAGTVVFAGWEKNTLGNIPDERLEQLCGVTGKPVDLARLPSPAENPAGFHGRYTVAHADGSPTDPDAQYLVLRIDGGGNDLAHLLACRYAAAEYADYVLGYGFGFSSPDWERVAPPVPHLAQMANEIHQRLESAGFDLWKRVNEATGPEAEVLKELARRAGMWSKFDGPKPAGTGS